MRQWMTLQREKGNDSRYSKFIQANPGLDITMRTVLANYLNMSEQSVQKWLQDYIMYQRGKSEYLNSQVKLGLSCLKSEDVYVYYLSLVMTILQRKVQKNLESVILSREKFL